MKRLTDAELDVFETFVNGLATATAIGDETKKKITMLISEVRERRSVDRFMVNATTTRTRHRRGRK